MMGRRVVVKVRQRAESREQRAQRREQRAESREQRAESREQRRTWLRLLVLEASSVMTALFLALVALRNSWSLRMSTRICVVKEC
jgi:hypothetical protein